MSNFVVNVADLRRSTAAEREIEVTATVDWAAELSRIAMGEGDNLLARLRLTPVGGGLMVHGTAEVRAVHFCHRCLEEYGEDMEIPVSALFSFNADGDGETFPLGDTIDLEPMLRDDILTAMPMSPTCPQGCAVQLGAEQENGLNTAASAEDASADGVDDDSAADEADKAVDERVYEGSPFAVLRDLLDDGD